VGEGNELVADVSCEGVIVTTGVFFVIDNFVHMKIMMLTMIFFFPK